MPRRPRPMSAEAIEQVARRFAVLAEPMRLRLLQALSAGERNVSTLAELTGGTQANVSRHLHMLTEQGILARRKEGLQVFYSISDRTIFEVCELVCGAIERRHERRGEAPALGPRSRVRSKQRASGSGR